MFAAPLPAVYSGKISHLKFYRAMTTKILCVIRLNFVGILSVNRA